MSPAEIEDYFHRKIPLTKAMEVRVDRWSGGQLVLTAPLEPNHNHMGTAFGGSLSALAMLAGYGLIWLVLGDQEAHVVVRRAAISYSRPVRGELRAVCMAPGEPEITRFREQFACKGKSRMTLRATVEEDGEIAVEFEGTYVAIS